MNPPLKTQTPKLAAESTNMLNNIEQVISTTVTAAEYTLGHREPLEPLEGTFDVLTLGIPKFRTRYASGASETTLTPYSVANGSSGDVEMEPV